MVSKRSGQNYYATASQERVLKVTNLLMNIKRPLKSTAIWSTILVIYLFRHANKLPKEANIPIGHLRSWPLKIRAFPNQFTDKQ